MDKLFALDIGTRSVVGLILDKNSESGLFRVVDFVSVEHQERAMLDGQIHDVREVSKVITSIKESLETKHGPLKKVCVAAAGRALKTKRVSYTIDLEQQPLKTEDDLFHLELAAVQKAQYALAEEQLENDETMYYCVGYSVLHYYLDGDKIHDLIDQEGEQASVEVIATFLPKIVVTSLLAALDRADLEMEALTLEPIAAIHVLIPPSMRRLNVALVDIGAGTSDIALTSMGTVTAYSMVPKAGDEITEALSDQFLLDFPDAEKVKRTVQPDRQVEMTDILGVESTYAYEEVVEQIDYAIDDLVNTITDEILSLNGRAPQAVMLVGGGSLTPELERKVAEKLGIDRKRVAVRSIEAIKMLEKNEDLPLSPEWVTPIGIAIAAKENPVHYIHVTVNEKPVRLFDVKQLTIGDCLLAAGLDLKKLYGKPGLAKMVSLNGNSFPLPGTLGEAPTIMINNEVAGIQTRVKHGDEIVVTKGVDGTSVDYPVSEIIGEVGQKTIFVNGQKRAIAPSIYVNDRLVSVSHVLEDGDEIVYDMSLTVESCLNRLGLKDLLEKQQPFDVFIDQKSVRVKDQMITFYKNGERATPGTVIEDGDQLTFEKFDRLTIEDICRLTEQPFEQTITVFFENKPIKLKKEILSVLVNGKQADLDTVVEPHDRIAMRKSEDQTFLFQDVFLHIDLKLEAVKGKRFQLYCNQEEVGFSHPIKDQDKLSIRWIASMEYKS